MNNTYQLSQSGIERLERFKRDIEAGDAEIGVGHRRKDGSVMFYHIISEGSVICVFTGDESDAVKTAIENINNTINGHIEMRHHSFGERFYCCKNSESTGLMRSDITTPAQRALEALGKKLQDRSAAWN